MSTLRKRLSVAGRLDTIDLLLVGFLLLLVLFTLLMTPWDERGRVLFRLDDVGHHVFRLSDSGELFDQGRFNSHLSPNASNGKGLPIYIYYSQWVYLIPFLFLKMGFSLLVSLKIAVCLFMLLSSVSFYNLLTLHARSSLAKIGTLLFLTTNYFLGDIFVRFAYSEFASYALLPLYLYVSHRALTEKNDAYTLYSILVAGSMILFHPVSLMNSTLAILVYYLFIFRERQNLSGWFWRVSAICTGSLAITMFFWLPAVIEKKYVFGVDRLPVSHPFLEFEHYTQPLLYNNLGPLLTLLFLGSLGLTIYLSIAGRRQQVNRQLCLLGAILLYFFFTLTESMDVWKFFTIMQSSAFAWRLVFPLAIITILFVVFSLSLMPEQRLSGKSVVFLCVLLVGQGTVFVFHSVGGHFTSQRTRDHLLQAYVSFYGGLEKGWGIAEYTPNRRIMDNLVGSEECVVSIAQSACRRESNNLTFRAPDDVEDCFLHVPFYWNVRFRATVDDVEVPIFANNKGEMLVLSDKGNELFQLDFTEPWYVKSAKVVSAAAVLLILLWAVVTGRRAQHGAMEST